jgi:hypothetical protein
MCWPWHQCNLAYPDAQGTETSKPLSLAYISKARIDDFHSLIYHRGSYKFVVNNLYKFSSTRYELMNLIYTNLHGHISPI